MATVGLVAFLALALLRASAHIRILFSVVCAVAGAVALWQGHASGLMEGLSQSQIFGGFLPSVLLLRATVQISPRSDALRGRMTALSPAQARHWTLVGSHGLGAILNVGAMAVLAPVVARNADTSVRADLASCAARGVGTAVMWSPFFVATAFTSSLVPSAPLWQVMAVGAGLALIGLTWAQCLFVPRLAWADAWASFKALGLLALPMSLILGSVLLLASLGYTGLQAVTLALPMVCGVYLFSRGSAVTTTALKTAVGHFSRLSDEMLIIVGAQIMGFSLAGLPEVQEWAQHMLPGLVSGGSLLMILVTALVCLGQFGVHPMIGVSLLVPVVAAGSFGISPVILVAAGVFSWGLSASVAVWTLPVAVAATAFDVPVSHLLTRKSAFWAVATGFVGCAYLVVLNALLKPI